jgi:proteasome assembly chaperone (PAC2) family protein
MAIEGIRIQVKPEVFSPVCIAGFNGWGNALDVSRGLVTYLVKRLSLKAFGDLVPDVFYRYDESRPHVSIEDGVLKQFSLPGGQLFEGRATPGGPDLVILKADEPTLAWRQFASDFLDLIESLGANTLITIGSMYDEVLPSERLISAMASDASMLTDLSRFQVVPISYTGPSAVHGILQAMAGRRKISCVSLWAHCPYYIQGVTHYGLMSQLVRIICSFAGCDFDTKDLDEKWEKVSEQIQEAVEESPKLQEIVESLKKDRQRGSLKVVRGMVDTSGKVVDLRDFFNSKEPDKKPLF